MEVIEEFFCQYYYFIIGLVFFVYLLYRYLDSLFGENNYTETKYNPRGHTWRSIQCNKSIPYNILCSVCNKLMLPVAGLFCECCALSACKRCIRFINKDFKCKTTTWPKDKPFVHHWVQVCSEVSEMNCDDRPQSMMEEFYCCWCQRLKQFNDKGPSKTEVCDFGRLKNVIIPPSCVTTSKGNIIITPVPDPNWEPIFILANKKSGSNKGDEVLSLFRGLLNPIQVLDLGMMSAESIVQWLPEKCRLLVAGGDGTVAWVLNALANSQVKACVGILPLGTGNDLSRVLGWGSTSNDELDATHILKSITQATLQPLDRWKITIRERSRRLRRARERTLYAYNYASIGVDARVALDFHRARSQFLYKYANRTINYLAYVGFGVSRALDDGGCEGLEKRLRVRVDDEPSALELPPLQGLVLLNIPSWGAGVDLWNLGGNEGVPEQRIDDGKIEVAGISSSFHIARLQCGLAEPYRFAQAKKVRMELEGSCAMQVDGEPWMQGSATLIVEHAGLSALLRCPDDHYQVH